MPKLSDTFLQLLGNQLQNGNGTAGVNGMTQASPMTQQAAPSPSASLPSDNSNGLQSLIGDFLEGVKQMSPIGIAESVRRGRQAHDARLAIEQAQNARANIETQTGLANSFNTVAPGTSTVNPQGSFQVNPQDASLTGLTPGTTYQPIQHTATTPFIAPGTKPGSASVQYSSRPLQRGEVTEPAINTLGPYGSLMLGQQKNIMDQANSYRTAANTALNQFTNMAAKEDPSIVTSFMQGVMPSLASIKDQSVAAAMPQLFNIYKQNKTMADQLTTQGMGLLGGNTPPTSSPTNVNTRPPPPASLQTQLASHPGTIPIWNKQTNQYGLIPQANFNPLLHEQVQTQTPVLAGAPQ